MAPKPPDPSPRIPRIADPKLQPRLPRLHHLDNFRTYLTCLVIYHHASLAYGGCGNWGYRPQIPYQLSLPLIAFNIINQSYFMGSFFFLSGQMSSKTLHRKGRTGFLKMKWMKLGIPALWFTFLGQLLAIEAGMVWKGRGWNWEVVWVYWGGLRGVRGPVWYCALLLIFDTIYAFLPPLPAHFSKNSTFSLFWPAMLLVIAASFLIRLIYPLGKVFLPLNLQPAFSAQYIACYTWGIISSSSNDLSSSAGASPKTVNLLLAVSLLTTILLLNLLSYQPISNLNNGFSLLSLVYAIWNETIGYLIGSLVLSLFSKINLLSRKWGSVGRYSYVAFLVHPIVLMGIQGGLEDWQLGFGGSVVLKTSVVGTLGCIGSWGVGWFAMKIPGVANIVG